MGGDMTVFVALLRGINVGWHRKLAMADLRVTLADTGFRNPQTFLQSGNLVFCGDESDGPALEERLEQAIADRLALRVEVLVRTAVEWASVVTSNPFPEEARHDPSHVIFMALKDVPSRKAMVELCSAARGPEKIQAVGRDLYVTYPNGIGRSKLTGAAIESRLATRGTGRNWRTVLKLAEMVSVQNLSVLRCRNR